MINYVCKGGNKELCQWLLLPSLCVCVQEWSEDKHQALELVCCLCGECVRALLVSVFTCMFALPPPPSQFCCFPLFPAASPNLSRLPLSSASEFTAHRPLLYLQPICELGSKEDKQVYRKNQCYTTRHTHTHTAIHTGGIDRR